MPQTESKHNHPTYKSVPSVKSINQSKGKYPKALFKMIQNTKILQLYKSSEQLFQIGDLRLSIIIKVIMILIIATIIMTLILANVIIKLFIIVITSTIICKESIIIICTIKGIINT